MFSEKGFYIVKTDMCFESSEDILVDEIKVSEMI